MTAKQEGTIQVNLRLSTKDTDAIDALVDEINAGGAWPRVTRSDLIRESIRRVVKERPPWLPLKPPTPKPKR